VGSPSPLKGQGDQPRAHRSLSENELQRYRSEMYNLFNRGLGKRGLFACLVNTWLPTGTLTCHQLIKKDAAISSL
jgi:hypothetical protein